MARRFKSPEAQKAYYARREHFERYGVWPKSSSSLSKAQKAAQQPVTAPKTIEKPQVESKPADTLFDVPEGTEADPKKERANMTDKQRYRAALQQNYYLNH